MRPALLASKIEPAEALRRARAFTGFQEYVAERGLAASLADAPCEDVDWVLAEYGQYLHDEGAAPTRFKLTILRLQDMRRHWRMRWAWAAHDAWTAGQPARSYPPAPVRITMAIFGVAILWGWDRTALAILLTWAAALRPGETCALTVGDLHTGDQSGFVVLQEPKTKHRSARRQYVRLWEPQLLAVLARLVHGAPPEASVCGQSVSTLRDRMASITRRLELPTGQYVGFTPASFRSGRATQLYEFWEAQGLPAAELARRLLRHDKVQTTDRYVQEVVAATLRLPAKSEERIRAVLAALPQLFDAWLARLGASTPGPARPRGLGLAPLVLDADDSD